MFRRRNAGRQDDYGGEKILDFTSRFRQVRRQKRAAVKFAERGLRQKNYSGAVQFCPDRLVAFEKRDDDGSVEQDITTGWHLSFRS
jgi:hypothetical protein